MRKFLHCLLSVFLLAVASQGLDAQCSANAGLDTLICPGDTLVLGDSANPGSGIAPLTFNWSNGDSVANPVVVVWDTTEFILTVTDGSGCIARDTITVFTRPLPDTPQFTFTPNGSCAPMTSNFSISNLDTNQFYIWNFGGPLMAAMDTNYSFDAIGAGISSFDISLTTIDSFGCAVTSPIQQAQVDERPDPNLVDPIDNFRSCAGDSFQLTVFNSSVPLPDIVSYTLDWGDGSPVWSDTVFPGAGLTHLYTSLGTYNIQFSATGTNGCSYTRTIPVFNTTNPAIAVGSPGSTSGCAPRTFCFPLLNWQGNGNSTQYIVNYGDGTPPVIYNHPPPDTICHTYDTTSCNEPGAPPIFPPDAYIFSITAANVCDSTPAAVGGIRVFTRPEAEFDIIDDTGCFVNAFDFDNVSVSGFDNNCDSTDFYLWDFGDGTVMPVFDASTQSHTYTTPGEYVVSLTAQDFCGNSVFVDTLCAQDTPIADFTITPDTGCLPLLSDATNFSNVLTDCGSYLVEWNVNYRGGDCAAGGVWAFRDSTNQNSVDARFRFETSGIYEIMLVVENTCGRDTMLDTVVVQEAPQVSLGGLPDFCDTALVTPVSNYDICEADTGYFNWSFTGGIPSVSSSPEPDSIFYANPGNYQIILTVQNVCGIVADTTEFAVYTSPNSNFTATEPCLGSPVVFTDQSTQGNPMGAPANNWQWDFGDGNNSGTQNPNHNYAAHGIYPVNLITTDTNGCADDTTIDIIVNPLPNPDFTWTDVCEGNSMIFADASSYDTAFSSGLTAWAWDFGDGSGSSNQQNPNYSYSAPGIYTVVLTVTDDNGCQDSISYQVTVYPNPVANFDAPDVCVSDSTFFTDLSLVAPLGAPLANWSWDFGDGSGISALQNPSYLYGTTGTYNVSLVVSDTFGCTDDTIIPVTVNPLPDASFSLSPTLGCHPLMVAATHTGSPGVNHFWYDNGVLVSTQANPSLILTNPSPLSDANHIITHVVEAGTACTDTITDTVLVFPQPQADFSFNPASTCAPDTLTVNNNSQAKGPASYLWSVNSSAVGVSSSSAMNPTFSFPDNQSGTDSVYQVTLIVSSVDGCLDTFTRNITIFSRPTADFNTPDSTCGPASIIPNNTSLGNGLAYNWSINPIAGINNPSLALPTISLPVRFSDSLIYRLELEITDINGCTDSTSSTFILYPKPTASFSSSNTDSCGDLTVQFSNSSTPNNGLETIADMSFLWSFGNGQSSSAQDPAATFTNSGVVDSLYIVELISFSPHSCADTAYDTITVYPNPNAEFSASNQADCFPFSIDSNIITTTIYPQANDNYTWLVDGVVIGNGSVFPGYTMLTGPDTIVVSLVTTNIHNCRPDTFDLEFRTIEQPVAAFSLPVNSGCHPLSINVTDSSTPGVNHAWYIDGVLVSNQQNPILTFRNNSNTNDSIQSLTLIVTAGTGCSDTISSTVTVFPKPLANFNMNSATACAPANIGITDLSQLKGPGNYQWSVNSSAVLITGASSSNPTFQFPDNQSGTDSTYTVTLILTSIDGCLDTATANITIYSRPVAAFNISDSSCGPATIAASNTSIGSGLNYAWSINPVAAISNPLAQNPSFTLPLSLNDSVLYTIGLVITDANGCVDSSFENSILYPKPTAAFNPSSNDSCGPLSVNFNNLSNPNNFGETINDMSFLWDFGNGMTSTLQNPAMIFTNSGVSDSSYIIELIATSEHGCSDTILDTITVRPNPVAQFAAINNINCAPFTIDSNNISLTDYPDANDSYTWLINGLITGTGPSFPGTTMPVDGDTITISLIAENIHGCAPDTFSLDFITISNPEADFAAIPNQGCSPLIVSFTDSSSPGVTWTWYIDGLLADTVQNPTFTFTNSSTLVDSFYQVDLVITAAGSGCSDTATESIRVFNQPNVQARTNFDTCINSGLIQLSGSSPVGGFYNGTGIIDSSGLFDPALAGLGFHQISYSYVDAQGCFGVDSFQIEILGLPFVDAGTDTTVCNQAVPVQLIGQPIGGAWTGPGINPAGSFTPSALGVGSYNMVYSITDTNGCQNQDTAVANVINPTFADAGTTDTLCLSDGLDTIQGFSPAGGSWSGPGIIDPLLGVFDPALTSPGPQQLIYSVGVQSCLSTDTNTYVVWQLPQASFTGSPSCIGDTSLFTDLSIANASSIISWNWDFGDSSGSVSQNPAHLYAASGNYPVSLTVVNSNGCIGDTTIQVTVNPLPNPSFSAPSLVCEDDSVFFVLDTVDAASYMWYWGDGDSSTGANPFHIYDDPGSYSILLIATTAAGCTDSSTSAINVADDPTAFFVPDPDSGCAPLNSNFFPIPPSTPFGGYTYYWEFGQGDTSFNFIPPTISFPPGVNGDTVYTVEYRVYSLVCQTVDVHFEDVVINPLPIAEFTTDIDSGCHPLAVNIQNNSLGLADSFYLDFGDGNDTIVTNLQDVPHTFTNTGLTDSSYTISIRAFNGCGEDSFQLSVTVFPNTVIADVMALDTLNCQFDTIRFRNSSQGAFFVHYDFGDGSSTLTSSDSIVRHSFADSGIFQVIQTVYSNDSCSMDRDTASVLVNGLPTVFAGNDTVVCNQNVAVQLFGAPFGGTWGDTLISSGGVFFPDSLEVGNNEFYYSYTAPLTGCQNSDTVQAIVTLTTYADAGSDTAICIDNGILNLAGGQPMGGVWSGTGLTDSLQGFFSPDSTGTGSFDLIYTYGDLTCLTRDTVTVSVNPLPTVEAGPDDTVCLNNGLVNLSPIIPFSGLGTWSGPGVDTSNNFNPRGAGVGNHVLTYQYADPMTGCSNIDSLNMTVLPLPFVDAGQDTSVCDQAIAVQLVGAPQGGTWNGPFISPAGEFFPINLGLGQTQMTYTVIDTANGCDNTDTMTVNVGSTIFADAGENDSICINNGLLNLSGMPVGGFWSGPGVTDSNGIFDPSVNGDGVFTLTYRYGVQTCRTLDSFDLTVNPLPTVYGGPDISHCINDPFITLTSAVPAGGVYAGPGIINQSGIINPRAAGIGVHTIIYTYTHPVTGCVNIDSFELTINGTPTSQFAFDPQDFGCQGPVTVNILDQSIDAIQYWWDFDNGQSSQQQQPTITFNSVGSYEVEQVVMNNFGCFDTSVQVFDVYPFPEINGMQALPDDGCVPLRVNFIPSTTAANTLYWDFGDGNVSGPVGTGNITHVYQDTGFYTVRLIAISNGDCGDTVSYVDTIKVRPRPVPDFTWTTNQIPYAFGGEATFSNLSIDAVRYLWLFGDGDSSSAENPVHIFENMQGEVEVTLIAWNQFGCPDTIRQIIEIPEYVKGLWVPNALSPEFGVGEVRVFQPKGVGLETYHCQIYNTWGELIWESTALIDGSPAEAWDGTFNGQIVPQDSYVWKIEATFLDGTVWPGKEYGTNNFQRIGTVTVIR